MGTVSHLFKPIVSCPTDNSEWLMELPDGTQFVGRWGTSQQRWQRRSDRDEYKDGDGNTVARVIWSNLAEGIYPCGYRSVPADMR